MRDDVDDGRCGARGASVRSCQAYMEQSTSESVGKCERAATRARFRKRGLIRYFRGFERRASKFTREIAAGRVLDLELHAVLGDPRVS